MNELVHEFVAARGYVGSLNYVSGSARAEGNFAKFEKYMRRLTKDGKLRRQQKLSFEVSKP